MGGRRGKALPRRRRKRGAVTARGLAIQAEETLRYGMVVVPRRLDATERAILEKLELRQKLGDPLLIGPVIGDDWARDHGFPDRLLTVHRFGPEAADNLRAQRLVLRVWRRGQWYYQPAARLLNRWATERMTEAARRPA